MLALEQDAAALLEPLQVDLPGNVILDPDHEHDHEAEHEREREIVMGQFGVSRHGRESLGAEQRQNEDTAEADVQARERQNDEAACRQPVGKPLEAGETQDLPPRETLTNANSP